MNSCCCRYLQEIGYTDTIIDVRSNRVRSLLGLNEQNAGGGGSGGSDLNEDNRSCAGAVVNGGDPSSGIGGGGGGGGRAAGGANKGRMGHGGGQSVGGGHVSGTALAEEMMIDTEAAVMANFDFLSSEVRHNKRTFIICLCEYSSGMIKELTFNF